MNIAVTGASGFIGLELVQYFLRRGLEVKALVRKDNCAVLRACHAKIVETGSLENCNDWGFLKGIDVVVHAAGHARDRRSALFATRDCVQANVIGTRQLLHHAIKHRVKRVIYLSSAKIYGDASNPEQVFSEQTPPRPLSVYASSKLEAELLIKEFSSVSQIEFVILRLPVVYGRSARGNIKYLLRAAAEGLPILVSDNPWKRSFIGIMNLVDLITLCVTSPLVANKTYNVSDGEDLSILELAQKVADLAGKSCRSVEVDRNILSLMGKLPIFRGVIEGLMKGFRLDRQLLMDDLSWRQPYRLEDELEKILRNDGN